MTKIHVIHENSTWVEPLAAAFEAQGLLWADWHLGEGDFDLGSPPPEGVFYNRMSASSHTRGHRYSAEYTAAVLAWLARHGRRVANGSPALDLEINKARQYAALEAAGIRTPRTAVVLGKHRIAETARRSFGAGPVILKPNRGGKGLGVQLFQTVGALEAYLESDAYEASADGIHLLQQYVKAPEPYIIRAEFIGGRFLYAVRVDTSDGFELCPADACPIGDAFCPAGEAPAATRPKFEIVHGIAPSLQASYERFLAASGIDVAGIEFILDEQGTAFTYDV
ncbi:ATP-grasp domain-containing protein, partial [Oceanibaculum pacificum]